MQRRRIESICAVKRETTKWWSVIQPHRRRLQAAQRGAIFKKGEKDYKAKSKVPLLDTAKVFAGPQKSVKLRRRAPRPYTRATQTLSTNLSRHKRTSPASRWWNAWSPSRWAGSSPGPSSRPYRKRARRTTRELDFLHCARNAMFKMGRSELPSNNDFLSYYY